MDHYQSTFETWDKVAQQYQDKFMDMDLYNDTYDVFCNLIEKRNATVFEIGCGPGNITNYLLNKRPDFILEAIDVAPNMVKLAKQNNPTAVFKIMDCRNIGTLPNRYDAIICGFCMPYLSKQDVVKLFKDCQTLLNIGGIAYFSTIEGEYTTSKFETSSNGEHTMFVYYYEEKYLTETLKQNNFEFLHHFRKSYFKSDGSEQTHLILIVKKH